jgi:hypothetical protein
MPIDSVRYQEYQSELERLLTPLTFTAQANIIRSKLIDFLVKNPDETDLRRLTRTIRTFFNDQYQPFIIDALAVVADAIDVINRLYTDLTDIDITRDLTRIRAIERANQQEIGQFSERTIHEIATSVRESQIQNETVSKLKDRLKRISSKAAFYAETIAQTQVKVISRVAKYEKASIAEVVYFEYIGARRPTIRPFCDEHLGNTYHINGILAMDNGSALPVIESCGGWNCVHDWEPDPFYEV